MDFKLNKVFFIFVILCAFFTSSAESSPLPLLSYNLEVRKIRYWTAPDHIRIVLDMSGESTYRVRELTGPHRIAIDIPGSRFSSGLKDIEIEERGIERIRLNRLSSGAQVVFDLPGKTGYNHFALKPFKNHPHRIVFDLEKSFSNAEIKRKKDKVNRIAASGDRIVIVDPGHGGSQPGACSKYGDREKDIVLEISKYLAGFINSTKGFKAILTREGDYNVALGKRIEIARSHGGDCFVSLHLNAYHHSRARGSEIYFLSLDGATDKNAQAVAERENFLLELGNRNNFLEDDVQSILLDLTKNDVLEKSSIMAECVAEKMKRINSLPFRNVKQANFVVLRSIAMPSILVESAFLSNYRDVKLLRKRTVLREIAFSIGEGIISFLRSNVPPNIAIHEKSYIEHIVKRGETLWSISREYGLPVEKLRALNNLDEGSVIRPEQKLRISGKE